MDIVYIEVLSGSPHAQLLCVVTFYYSFLHGNVLWIRLLCDEQLL